MELWWLPKFRMSTNWVKKWTLSLHGSMTAFKVLLLVVDLNNFQQCLASDFTWTPLDTNSSQTIEDQVCHGNNTEKFFCCNFNITLTTSEETGTSYSYLLVAFSGLRHYPSLGHGGFEICGVIACLNSSISSCGQRFPKYDEIVWPVKFENITITANFEDNASTTQFPNSLLSSIRPINANETEWSGKQVDEDGQTVIQRTFAFKKSQNRVLTFAIYGRDFGQDVSERE